MKKQKCVSQAFSTENEFMLLLQIHNEIKYMMTKNYSHLKPKLIDSLFTILSSQALLYDQILRKGITHHDSLIKQSHMGKLLQGNKNTLVKNINELFNSLSTNFYAPLKESKSETFSILSTLKNTSFLSPDDSLLNLEQESMITRIKRKMKIENNSNHVRTNSICVSSNIMDLEGTRKQKLEKDKQTINTSCSGTSEQRKPNDNSKRMEKKRNSISHTQSNLINTSSMNTKTQSNLNTITHYYPYNTISGLNDEKETREKAPRIVLSCQAFPELEENNKDNAKPSHYAKKLLKKYQDIVGAFEKIDSDEETENKRSESNTIRLNIKCLSKNTACETSRGPKISIALNNKLFSPITNNNTNTNSIHLRPKKKEKKPVTNSTNKEKKGPKALKF